MQNYQRQKLKPEFRITDLINMSYYDLPEDFSFSGESHDFWELSYVDRGQVAIQLGENTYLLKAGEMLFCRPNTFHNCRVWQGKPAAIVDIAFDVEGLVLDTLENEIIVLSAEERHCMAAIIREAAQAYIRFDNLPGQIHLEKTKDAPYGGEQIISNRLEELLIYASRSSRHIHIDSRRITATPPPENTSTAAWVQTYLQEHYDEKLTLERIAQAHCISMTKLKRVFRDETGGSVIAYLTQVRIKAAKQLLREGKLNFSQIAERVGFESIHYFSTVFKKQTGMTPTEYTRSLHKK